MLINPHSKKNPSFFKNTQTIQIQDNVVFHYTNRFLNVYISHTKTLNEKNSMDSCLECPHSGALKFSNLFDILFIFGFFMNNMLQQIKSSM